MSKWLRLAQEAASRSAPPAAPVPIVPIAPIAPPDDAENRRETPFGTIGTNGEPVGHPPSAEAPPGSYGARPIDAPPPPAVEPPPPGVPREWAEGVAALAVIVPPTGWPPDAWAALQADAARFLREHAAGAAGLGWTALELFGAHRSHPWQRIDGLGLVPLLKGGRVLTIHSAGAVIEMRSGSRLTFYRRETPETVPVWRI